ncbi:hypothetical protein [Natronosalvus amylolyticus]|uniref:hypothetical protein n=1 Tax=Natronosalvus amylolyticus TaxID=2961994 RepID=UPI0020C99F9C|nr:hypothetical protein [Natronosalvus amylolyticus]
MNVVSKVAMVLVVVGILLLSGPVFGFTTFSADRGVTAETAETEQALLAISGTDATPTNQNDAVILEITNNANVDFTSLETSVTIEGDNDRISVSDPFDDQLASDEQTGLEVTCERGGGGEATVRVDADAFGSELAIEGVTYEHTFAYTCTGQGDPGGGFTTVQAGDVDGPGPTTQTLSFTPDGSIGNGDTVTIAVSATQGGWFIGADYTDASADIVGQANDDVEIVAADGGEIVLEVTAQGQIKDGDELVVELSNVETVSSFWFDFGFGSAEFTRSDSGESGTDSFWITESAATGTMTTQHADGLGSTTVTESELEQVDIDELDAFDTHEELIAELRERDGVEVIDDT